MDREEKQRLYDKAEALLSEQNFSAINICTKNLLKIAAAILVAFGATAMLRSAQAASESCEYAFNSVTDPSNRRTLLMTKSHFLQTPVDINDSHAALSAARLTVHDPHSERLYIHLTFRLVEFVKTEDEARSRRDLTNISEHMPLVIELADGSTLMLPSWGEVRIRSRSHIHGPTEMGNSSDFFRVSHVAGGSYWLDDEQLTALLDQPATTLQVTTTQGDFSMPIHPSRTDRLQHVLSCVSLPGDRLEGE
ncbi:MAG: hypothetical protein ACR2PZ_26395 [Pseudomonadales bacterium]